MCTGSGANSKGDFDIITDQCHLDGHPPSGLGTQDRKVWQWPPTFVTPRTKATMLLGDPTPAPEVLTRFACCMWLLNCVTSWQLGITPIVKTFWTGAGRSSLWSGAGRVPSPSRSIFWSLQSFPVLNGWGPRGNFPRRGRSSPSSRRSGSDFQVLEWRWLASPK